MSNYVSLKFSFDIFEPLKPPLEATLKVLEVVEAILEVLLDIIKSFLLDLLNPLRALVAALLAALRAIINQIRSAGIAILLVHPDFGQPDFGGVLNSVSGGYRGFESKVVSKFFDTSDLFRPQYPPGSSVAMLVFYVGADSPGNLLSLLFNLLALIKHPVRLSGLPAPVGLKATPVKKGGDAISQFRNLFELDLDQSVQLEWRMPQAPGGTSAAGFSGQIVSFYNAFRFPNFIIERHGPFPQGEGEDQLDPRGESIRVQTNSNNLGEVIDGLTERYSFPKINSLVAVREEDGTVHRVFNSKRAIQFGGDGQATVGRSNGSPTSALAADTSLIRGIATGTYRFLDESDLLPGRTYYYRVRAFFGDATDYLSLEAHPGAAEQLSGLSNHVVQSGNFQILKAAPKLTLGKPSRVVKGFVPEGGTVEAKAFNAYKNVFDAILAGLLLNFDLPPAGPDDDLTRQDQKTGWGVLGLVGGQTGAAKAAVAGNSVKVLNSTKALVKERLSTLGSGQGTSAVPVLAQSAILRDDILFRATARRLANSVVDKLVDNTAFRKLLADKWSTGVNQTVDGILKETKSWFALAIAGGFTSETNRKIEAYLSLEDTIVNDGGTLAAGDILVSPLPVRGNSPPAVTVQKRADLADFLRTALSVSSSASGYLSWYSVTVGDLFPALTPFLLYFEDFLASLLKAVESALKELADIIETLLQKVRALKQIIGTILSIIDLLNISVTVSVLAVVSTSGSAESLAGELTASGDKPTGSPFGLHSGLVLTAGGPGAGFVAALSAIKFILGA